MQRTRKRHGPALPPDQFALDHPFARWYASYHKRGAARCEGRDLYMGELAARRFSIGLDDDKVPVLGIAEDDVEAVTALSWAGAAFIRRVRGRDWIALSCKDARIEGARADAAVPLRMWLPTTDGLLDGWRGLAKPPGTLRVVEAYIRLGKPEPKGAAPLYLLPLSFKGAWEAAPEAGA